MLLRCGVVALAAVATAQSIPNTRTLVDLVSRYVETYQRDFVELVADEETTQEVRMGDAVTATRVTRGELFSTFLSHDGVWMSVHDITMVDGSLVAGAGRVRALLQQESFESIAPRIAAENARHNIGSVVRNFNEPTLALLPFTRRYVDRFTFERGNVDRSDPQATLVALALRDREGDALIRSLAGQRVRLRGTALVEAVTGRVRRTSVMFADGVGTATHHTNYAFDDHVDCWVPIAFEETYVRPARRETITVKTTLSNYRRFGVSVRIK